MTALDVMAEAVAAWLALQLARLWVAERQRTRADQAKAEKARRTP